MCEVTILHCEDQIFANRYECQLDDTLILTAKNQIFLQTGIPEGNQLLFWAGTCLEDLMTFQEYSMT